jgi:hypothetical protein
MLDLDVEGNSFQVRSSATRRWITILLVLLGISVSTADGKRPDSVDEKKSRKVSLTASPLFGYAPLNVQLVATLSGIDSQDRNFCHAGITWIRVDPGASPENETRMSETPRCIHGEGELRVNTTFSKTFDLDFPGSYLYRVVITGKDGSEIRSNFVTVRVLRIP